MYVIKKYNNRRLYDSNLKTTITLDTILEYILRGKEIVVIDNRTGKDVTVQVLSRTFLKLISRNKSEDFVKFLFFSLIREFQSNPANFLSRLIQAGIGTEYLNTEKLYRIVEEFTGKGELTVHEKESYFQTLLNQLQNSKPKIEDKIREELKKHPDRLEEISSYFQQDSRL